MAAVIDDAAVVCSEPDLQCTSATGEGAIASSEDCQAAAPSAATAAFCGSNAVAAVEVAEVVGEAVAAPMAACDATVAAATCVEVFADNLFIRPTVMPPPPPPPTPQPRHASVGSTPQFEAAVFCGFTPPQRQAEFTAVPSADSIQAFVHLAADTGSLPQPESHQLLRGVSEGGATSEFTLEGGPRSLSANPGGAPARRRLQPRAIAGSLPDVEELMGGACPSSAPSSPSGGLVGKVVVRRAAASGPMPFCVKRGISLDTDVKSVMGPLDKEHMQVKHRGSTDRFNIAWGVDPIAVYVRLANFAARNRGVQRRRSLDAPSSCEESCGSRSGSHEGQPGRLRALQGELSPYFPPKLGDVTGDFPGVAGSRPGSPRTTASSRAARSAAPSLPLTPLSARSTTAAAEPAAAVVQPPLAASEGAVCGSDFAPDPVDEIELIQNHLEEMNIAAGRLNSCQAALNASAKERLWLIQLWAVGSARLARAVGAHNLAKAAPHHACKRRFEEARLAVEAASRDFAAVAETKGPPEHLDQLAARHVACLEAFLVVKRKLQKSELNLGESLLGSAAAYFEAEAEHHEQLAQTDADLSTLQRAAAVAKARYHSALRSLEELSERAHRRRLERLGAEDGDREAARASPPRRRHAAADTEGDLLDRHHSIDSTSSAAGSDQPRRRHFRSKTVTGMSRRLTHGADATATARSRKDSGHERFAAAAAVDADGRSRPAKRTFSASGAKSLRQAFAGIVGSRFSTGSGQSEAMGRPEDAEGDAI